MDLSIQNNKGGLVGGLVRKSPPFITKHSAFSGQNGGLSVREGVKFAILDLPTVGMTDGLFVLSGPVQRVPILE